MVLHFDVFVWTRCGLKDRTQTQVSSVQAQKQDFNEQSWSGVPKTNTLQELEGGLHLQQNREGQYIRKSTSKTD